MLFLHDLSSIHVGRVPSNQVVVYVSFALAYLSDPRCCGNENPITWTMQSRHLLGEAIDVVPAKPNGEPNWSTSLRSTISTAATAGSSASFSTSPSDVVPDWRDDENGRVVATFPLDPKFLTLSLISTITAFIQISVQPRL